MMPLAKVLVGKRRVKIRRTFGVKNRPRRGLDDLRRRLDPARADARRVSSKRREKLCKLLGKPLSSGSGAEARAARLGASWRSSDLSGPPGRSAPGACGKHLSRSPGGASFDRRYPKAARELQSCQVGIGVCGLSIEVPAFKLILFNGGRRLERWPPLATTGLNGCDFMSIFFMSIFPWSGKHLRSLRSA